MIKNYFKIAWRHLRRNKSYAFINVAGLTLGITCSILIFILVRFQLSFDNFHPDTSRIHRVVTDIHHDNISYTPGTPFPLGKVLRMDDSIAQFYEVETVLLTLIEIFAGIAIFIGCLGLYGLVSFMALRKTKEIGVRKVLGAGVFLSAIFFTFLIAALTVGYRSLRSALANPVKSLRTE